MELTLNQKSAQFQMSEYSKISIIRSHTCTISSISKLLSNIFVFEIDVNIIFVQFYLQTFISLGIKIVLMWNIFHCIAFVFLAIASDLIHFRQQELGLKKKIHKKIMASIMTSIVWTAELMGSNVNKYITFYWAVLPNEFTFTMRPIEIDKCSNEIKLIAPFSLWM